MNWDSVPINMDVYVEPEKFFAEVDEDVLVQAVKDRGYSVFSGSEDVNDPDFIAETAERVIAITNYWKTENREEGIKLLSKLLTRVFAFL